MDATEVLLEKGYPVACLSVRHINPLPDGFGELLKQFKQVLVLENNLGQFCIKLRAEFLLDLKKFSKVQGSPFNVIEITQHVEAMLIDYPSNISSKPPANKAMDTGDS